MKNEELYKRRINNLIEIISRISDCNKEKKMGKFERYCCPHCRYHATQDYVSSYKIGK